VFLTVEIKICTVYKVELFDSVCFDLLIAWFFMSAINKSVLRTAGLEHLLVISTNIIPVRICGVTLSDVNVQRLRTPLLVEYSADGSDRTFVLRMVTGPVL
jgi:hypothetical protein